jgi:hypothetical protein
MNQISRTSAKSLVQKYLYRKVFKSIKASTWLKKKRCGSFVNKFNFLKAVLLATDLIKIKKIYKKFKSFLLSHVYFTWLKKPFLLSQVSFNWPKKPFFLSQTSFETSAFARVGIDWCRVFYFLFYCIDTSVTLM